MKTIEEVLNLLPEANREDVKSFLKGLEAEANKIKAIDSREKAEDFILSNDLFKRAFDSRVSKAVDKYKVDNFDIELEKQVDSKLKEELQKIADQNKKTPEQERIISLEEKIKQAEVREQMNNRKDLTILELSNRNLDIGAASLLIGNSDEITRLNIDNFDNIIKPYKNQIEELKQKLNIQNAQTGLPGNGNNFEGIKNPFKYDKDGNPGRNADLVNKLYKENKPLYDKFRSEHQTN